MSQVDPSTFSWVKDEIDESIKQARLSLEAFSTSTDDTSQMRMAVAFLHQVSGTLQIVELDGAARLVNELELVCEGLIDADISATEENLDVLSRGVLSLSTYISQLHAGYPDSIVALTPLINELRTARSTEHVTEYELFNPELDVYPEVSANKSARLSDEDFRREAIQARNQLLATMLRWFTQKDDKQALGTILLLFTHLKNISRFDVTSQLWWIATALTEALRDGGLDSTNKETKHFFAQLEQELKRIIQNGESALVKSPQDSLLKRMLFLIGRSESRGPVVTEIVNAFELDEQVSGKPTKETGEIFEATSPEILQPIMKALDEELSTAEAQLNQYVDCPDPDAKTIDPLLSSLDKIRGAVDIINKKKLQNLVEEISHTALAYDAGAIVINSNVDLGLAEALLTLQKACSELDDTSSDWEEKVSRSIADLYWIRTGEQSDGTAGFDVDGIDIDEEGTLTDVEFSQLVKVVATEISANLEDVVEKFEKYSLNMHLNEILRPIPDKLRQIEGALQVLERKRAIELILLINEQITSMAEGRISPSTEHVESTALAISAVESYAESLQHDQLTNELMLERAMEELLRTAPSDISDRETAIARVIHIRDEADDWFRNPEDKLHLATLRKDMAAIIALAKRNEDVKLEKIADEVASLVSMLSEDPEYLTDDIMTTFLQSLSILEKLTGRLPDETPLAAIDDSSQGEKSVVEAAVPGDDLGIHLDEISDSEFYHETDSEGPSTDVTDTAEDSTQVEAEILQPEIEEVAREAAVFDDEILEVFLEEAREIATTGKDLVQKLKSDSSDEVALADLRRSFHTLKGSGRMSGAVEFGEFAWSMEELLNNIIAGKIEANEQIFNLYEEAVDRLPPMLDDLEKHDESNIDVPYWQEYVSKVSSSDDQLIEDAIVEAVDESSIEVVLPETEDTDISIEDESDIEADDEVELELSEEREAVELEAEAIDAEPEEIEESEAIEELEEIPGLPAPLQSAVVRDIYTTEINKHLDDLLIEVNKIREHQDPEVTEVMHRLIHTLRGSARSVGFDIVADSYESVENLLDGLGARSLDIKKEDIDIIQTAYDLGIQLLESVRQPRALEDHLLAGMAELSKICHKRLEHLPNSQMLHGTIEMPSYCAVDDTDDADESPVDKEELEEESDSALDIITAEENEVTEESADTTEQELASEVEQEVVPEEPVNEMVEIFREEAIDLLSRFQGALDDWRSDPENKEASNELKRIFHTIKGSARMTGVTAIGDLAHNTESMLEQSERAENNIDEPLFELIGEVHDTLLMMVENPGSSEFDDQAMDVNQRALDYFSSVADEPSLAAIDEESLDEEVPEDKPGPEIKEKEKAGSSEDEAATELLEIFREEATDLLSRFHEVLENWRNEPDSHEVKTELQRIFHTIKGGARMTGITAIGDLAHSTESMLELSEQTDNNIDGSLFDLIEEVHDILLMMIEKSGSSEFDMQAAEMNQRVLNHFSADLGHPPTEAEAQPDESAGGVESVETIESETPQESELKVASAEVPVSPPQAEKIKPVLLRKEKKTDLVKHAQVRVDSELLGTLANYAGEVSIARSRIQQQISNFKENLGELHKNIERFNSQIRELEIQADTQILSGAGGILNEEDEGFDPLEFDRYTQLQFLSRNLSESLHDLMMIQSGMDNFAGDVELLLHEQSRLNTDLQEGLTQTRMVAFTTLMPRLRQLTRKTSRELSKPVKIELIGGEVEIDRNVIDQVVPPMEHLIRNSISHGVESKNKRKKLGKPDKGLLKLEISREGKDIIIGFSDDGQGLDLDRIRSKAEERGLLDKGMNPSDEHLANLIFVPGFSTAANVTQVSGRGVGMDVVQSELKQIGGSVSLVTEKDKGTRFTIRLPLTMTVAQAMIVASGGHRFAVPLMSIVSINMVYRSRIIADASGERSVTIGDKSYPYLSLAERLGMLAQLEDDVKVPALMMNSATGPVVVGVDELIHATEIVVKPVGVQLAALDGIEGATVLSDGEVALILDLADLWNTRHSERADIDQASLVAKLEEEVSPATVMVVDDSLTVRRVTERNLSKYGVTTLLATDGIDAIEKLSEEIPDVMLVDIEMPRMDGFELTERVREDPSYKDIPIIIITSRSGPKHRERAMKLGATLYLTKPYQEVDLMNAINSVLPLESSRKISAMMEA
jgi:chemosensory pili system protein ChpA (sensor histidine kinase/response regulator)